MKQIIPSEQKSRIISYIVIIAAGMAMLALLLYFRELWSVVKTVLKVVEPFLIGFALAFLQIPIVRRIEWAFSKTCFRRKPRPKLSRALATTLSLLIILAILASFIGIMLPQIIVSLKSIIAYSGTFINDHAKELNELLGRFDFFSFDGEQFAIQWENMITQTIANIDVLVASVMTISSTIYTLVFNLFVGLITAFYLLMDKERFCAQAKKVSYALFRRETCEQLIYWTRRANRIFAGFITGKILDSLIIGVLCYLGMLLFRMEYPLLISVIVGVTNVIPFFGPFIGAIPSILILLIINPYSALWFAIFVLCLQQLDGNVIGPLILGDYVGISPLWIMISIVIGDGLFGFAGMLLSVPVFALCYAFVKAMIELRLKERSLPEKSDDYAGAPESFKDKE